MTAYLIQHSLVSDVLYQTSGYNIISLIKDISQEHSAKFWYSILAFCDHISDTTFSRVRRIKHQTSGYNIISLIKDKSQGYSATLRYLAPHPDKPITSPSSENKSRGYSATLWTFKPQANKEAESISICNIQNIQTTSPRSITYTNINWKKTPEKQTKTKREKQEKQTKKKQTHSNGR